MPNQQKVAAVPVVGTQANPVSPEIAKRVQQFLGGISVKRPLSAVVVLPSGAFEQAARTYSPEHQTSVAFSVGDRAYLNADVFDPKKNGVAADDLGVRQDYPYLPELALAHELSHLQDTGLNPILQEKSDALYNSDAADMVRKWLKQRRAGLIQQARRMAQSARGALQPVSPSVPTQLFGPSQLPGVPTLFRPER